GHLLFRAREFGRPLSLVTHLFRQLDQHQPAVEVRGCVRCIQANGLAESILGDAKLLLFHHNQPEPVEYRAVPLVYLARPLQRLEGLIQLTPPVELTAELEVGIEVITKKRDRLSKKGYGFI